MRSPLGLEIQREYERLSQLVAEVPVSLRKTKKMEGTGGKVSVADLIAYQIGWGKCVIGWYETGIKGQIPAMPGEGFTSWDYVRIAEHFYQKYQCNDAEEQNTLFRVVVGQILEIVEREDQTGNLDKLGVWSWCTLQSGKEWPLSKWIKVNTCAPYKRAILQLRRFPKT